MILSVRRTRRAELGVDHRAREDPGRPELERHLGPVPGRPEEVRRQGRGLHRFVQLRRRAVLAQVSRRLH